MKIGFTYTPHVVISTMQVISNCPRAHGTSVTVNAGTSVSASTTVSASTSVSANITTLLRPAKFIKSAHVRHILCGLHDV
jgi:hypothetical protein